MVQIGRYHINASFIVSWALKIVLLAVFFAEFYVQDYLVAIGTLVALTISLIPAGITRNYHINLPWVIDLAITTALTLHFVGLFYNLYHDQTWWWWDHLTHFIGTAVIGLMAFYITFALDYTKKLHLTLPFIVISTITAALAIGALWEIAEYYFDHIFGTNTVQGIDDTIHDLVFDLLGAIVVSIIGALYTYHLRQKQHGISAR